MSEMKENYRRNDRVRTVEAPGDHVIYGRNAVIELLESDRSIDKIFIKSGEREGSLKLITSLAANKKIPVLEASRQKLDELSGGGAHQGVVAMAAEKEYVTVEEILAVAEERGEKPFIVVADGIEDPYNLGAIIRTAECAGVHGLIIPKRRASGLTAVVAKASAGALQHLPIARVANLASEIEKLKKMGLWVYAAEAGGTDYYACDMSSPTVLILGSEGNGVSRLLKDISDYTVSIPMYGHITSMNVSAAAAVLMCEVARQHKSVK